MEFSINGIHVSVTESESGTHQVSCNVSGSEGSFGIAFPMSSACTPTTIGWELHQRLMALTGRVSHWFVVKSAETVHKEEMRHPERTRLNKVWTQAENKELLRMYFQNVSYEQIAVQLNRTEPACRIQAARLLRNMNT